MLSQQACSTGDFRREGTKAKNRWKDPAYACGSRPEQSLSLHSVSVYPYLDFQVSYKLSIVRYIEP